MQSAELCKACGCELKIIYYQRRAADEPPDKVVYCENCPLDTSRLSLKFDTEATKSSSKQLSSTSKSTYGAKLLEDTTKLDNKVFITVGGRAAIQCLQELKKSASESISILATPVYINTSTKPILSYYYLNSKTKNEVYTSTSSNTLAPFITCKEVQVYTTSNSDSLQIKSLVIGYEYDLLNIPVCDFAVLRTLQKGQKPYILISVSDSTDAKIMKIIESILVRYGTEISIKSIISNTLLNTLFIQSGRAYDWPSAPDNGYTYAWKPDGERFWYVKYGSIWLFCRRLLSGKIVGWNLCTSIKEFTGIGPILDVELMIGYSPIFIDLLVKSNSEPMPVSRTLHSVLEEYNYSTEDNTIDIPIHVRDYYRSDKELLATKDYLQYPVDGIVGIQDGSMTIIKLKDKKSIELELLDNGDLVTSDKSIVATSELHLTEEIGSIIEIRFEKQSTSDIPTITEVFTRTDKTKANDMQACMNIMNSTSDTPDNLARRNVVQWCNSIRSKLNQVASKIPGKGRVILDIGAGDGQAISDYSNNPEVTYLLLEPSERKCRSMFRRLQGIDKSSVRIFYQASDVLNALRLLITKKVKYVIVCASLRSILNQKDCIRTFKDCIRCCIASLSISYIVDELQELAIEGLDVIGFGYMYDLADNKGSLVNEHGVIMRLQKHDSKNAIVKWGTDIEYVEPAILLKDFKSAFYCKLAKTVVPTTVDSKVSLLNTISSRIHIITTSKYII